jgi:hypothetical protein
MKPWSALVLMLTTSILGPVLTEHFAPRLLKRANTTAINQCIVTYVAGVRQRPMRRCERLFRISVRRFDYSRT